MKTHPLEKARKSVHAAFFVLLVLAVWQGVAFTGCTYLQIGFLRLVCPVGVVEASLASGVLYWNLLPGFAVTLGLVVLLGRAYCAWMCPATFAAQQLTHAGARLLPARWRTPVAGFFARCRGRMHALWHPGKGDALALCAGLGLGIVLAGYPAWSVICPVGTLSRGIIDAVIHHSLRWDSVFLLLPVLVGLFHCHGWKCLCPLGTVHGAVSHVNRTFRLRVTECKHCGLCTRRCPLGLEPSEDKGEFADSQCMKCGACLSVCPRR